jgi:hypothetical protein
MHGTSLPYLSLWRTRQGRAEPAYQIVQESEGYACKFFGMHRKVVAVSAYDIEPKPDEEPPIAASSRT